METIRLVAMGTENTQERRPALSYYVIFMLKEKSQNNTEDFVKIQTDYKTMTQHLCNVTTIHKLFGLH